MALAHVEGFGLVLRPVEESDSEDILALRSDPELTLYLPPLAITREQQAGWIRSQRARGGDWYFAIARRYGGHVEGYIGLYGHDPDTRSAEWGRWILRPGSLAAWESEFLLHRFALETLELAEVFCLTITLNNRALKNHDQMGAERTGLRPNHFELRGQHFDAVEHRMTAARWKQLKHANEAQARKYARLLGAPRGA